MRQQMQQFLRVVAVAGEPNGRGELAQQGGNGGAVYLIEGETLLALRQHQYLFQRGIQRCMCAAVRFALQVQRHGLAGRVQQTHANGDEKRLFFALAGRGRAGLAQGERIGFFLRVVGSGSCELGRARLAVPALENIQMLRQ